MNIITIGKLTNKYFKLKTLWGSKSKDSYFQFQLIEILPMSYGILKKFSLELKNTTGFYEDFYTSVDGFILELDKEFSLWEFTYKKYQFLWSYYKYEE